MIDIVKRLRAVQAMYEGTPPGDIVVLMLTQRELRQIGDEIEHLRTRVEQLENANSPNSLTRLGKAGKNAKKTRL